MNTSAPAVSAIRPQSYLSEYDAISEVMERYSEGVRAGSSAMIKPAFHESCTFFGYYYNGDLLAGPIQMLFDWVDANGPAEAIQFRIIGVDVAGSTASE
jgi:Putative lumazine-binding